MKKKAKTTFEESSGNVFADLGRKDAEGLYLRARLGAKILQILHDNRLLGRDDNVAGAKAAAMLAKGNVKIKRQGGLGLSRSIAPDALAKVILRDLVQPFRRRRIAGIARAGLVVFLQKFRR